MKHLPPLPFLLRWIFLPLFAVCCSVTWGDREVPKRKVEVGIQGHYRVGCWTGVRLTGNGDFSSIETRDGDGVQVEYVQPSAIANGDWGYLVPGSEAAPLIVRNGSEVIASTRFPTIGSPSRGPAMIPLKMPWIVAFGDPLGVDQIGANKLLDRDALLAVSMPTTAAAVPDSVLGYDGVDMMVIGGSSSGLLGSLNEKQRRAIEDWITTGGRLFLTLGKSSPELMRAAPWLLTLLPIDDPATIQIDPSAIETYTSTQTPLEPFVGVRLPKDEGRVLIMGRTVRRVAAPVAVDYNVGFGRITVVAADLEDELFAAWPERLDLMTRLTGTILIPEQEEPKRRTRATAYDDLAGQMRSTLDRFAIKRHYGFSIVSLILMALVTAIGPLDYFLINRLLGRPLLGWISFPLLAIGLSVLLAYEARPVRGARSTVETGATESDESLTCNRIEIVDIDSTRGIGLGFSASYLYAHEASRFDITVTKSKLLSGIAGGMKQMLTRPFGYPGESFGGIQIAIEDGRLPMYRVPFQQTDSQGTDIQGTDIQGTDMLSTSLRGLPLASRSSKGIVTRCWFTPKLLDDVSLQRRPGSELLQGELANPLPIDLLDGMLIYRNWAYLLPTRFPAGGRIGSVDALNQKNFRWQLSHQKALESATETEAWDPTASDSSERIAEMLMFHEAVGGSRYTTLRDEPLSFLDLSHVLADDRCILLGRVAGEFLTIEAKNQDSTREPSGRALTLIRVVLPVNDSQPR